MFVIFIGGVVLNTVLKISQRSILVQAVDGVQFLAASFLSTLAVYGSYEMVKAVINPDVADFYASWKYLPTGINGVVLLVVCAFLVGLLIRRKN